MTDYPASFARFKWDESTLMDFHDIAVRRLEDELSQKPDMTLREQSYFFRMARTDAMLNWRTDDLKEVCREVERKDEEIKILEAQLENQGDLTKRRGAYIWQVSDTLERHFGVATLEEVDIVRLLQEKAPLEIRIKASAKNPYKLAKDASDWLIRLAEEAGRKVKRGVSTIRKLRCLRFYDNVTVPKRLEKRRRVHGEPKQKQAWAVANENAGFFREFQKDSYDPGG